MMPFDGSEHPHRRPNPLTGEAVVVSPHRMQRPWQGRREAPASAGAPRHDPACYLCPGNTRAGGARNPDYETTFVFTNDFAALLPGVPEPESNDHPLLRREAVRGTCQVICFSPRHDLTLAQFAPSQLRRVVDLWAERAEALGRTWRWVQIFENKGEAMGASNPHPHGQIWAMDRLPGEALKEDAAQRAWADAHDESLLVAYQRLERARDERVVSASEHWLAVVPWWAVWPFELLILPVRPMLRLPEMTEVERDDLAHLLNDLFPRLDALFDTSFPYSMGWHGAPTGPETDAEGDEHWQLHAHLYPPLLRSATVRKFMVGFELLGEPQRDLTPEAAAARLRALTVERPPESP